MFGLGWKALEPAGGGALDGTTGILVSAQGFDFNGRYGTGAIGKGVGHSSITFLYYVLEALYLNAHLLSLLDPRLMCFLCMNLLSFGRNGIKAVSTILQSASRRFFRSLEAYRQTSIDL